MTQTTGPLLKERVQRSRWQQRLLQRSFLRRSSLQRNLLKTLLPGGCLLFAAPALSLPVAEVSYSATDLLIPDYLKAAIAPTNRQLTDPSLALTEFQLHPSHPLEEIQATEESAQTLAQATPQTTDSQPAPSGREEPRSIRDSPVLEKWQRQIPNILEEIKRDPSFRTRARLGLSYFPSTFDSFGWNVGIEDVFLARIGTTGLTLSGDYQATFTGKRKAGGADLRYYVLPLGGYFNIAPVFGYRYLETPRYITDGLNVGFRLQAVLSRTGGADISFTQTWVAPQRSEEVGITKLSFGYALTRQLRLSTDVEKQNSKQKKDTHFGISLEWMF